MKFALFSDIHSNWEALETAAAHSRSLGAEKWVVLGDTVGYGADPDACLDWVLRHAQVNLMGNHERAVIDPALREWFNPLAREAIVWTEQVLDPALKEHLNGLQYLRVEKQYTFAHGSPDQPEEFRYLTSFEDARSSFRSFEGPLCFVGHTHIPCCFCESRRSAEHLPPGIVHLVKGERYILNPGSVGQPRDRDPRLSFGIYDDRSRTFEIVRLEYDNRKAADKIRRAGLPAYLADRLL